MFSNTLWFATYILLILEASALSDQLYDEVEEHGDEILPYCTSNFNNGSWGPCPPWSTCQNNSSENTSCTCAKIQWEVHINCAQNYTEIEQCNCITYDQENVRFVQGNSMYCCTKREVGPFSYIQIANNIGNFTIDMCSELHRNGTLCGSCINNYWPLAYSYDLGCVQCPSSQGNWIIYALVTLGPITIFYMIVIIFKISITSPYIYSFIFYAQAISTPIMVKNVMLALSNKKITILLVKFLSSFYGIWSMDFFRAYSHHICLRVDTLQLYALELVLVLYPVLLVALSYFLMKAYYNGYRCIVHTWKPFKWLISQLDGNKENTRSLVDAYTVFFNISLTRILYVSVDILCPTRVNLLRANGSLDYDYVLLVNGTIKYMNREHMPYAILALVFGAVFVLLPTALLFLYPFKFLQLLINWLPQWIRISLHHFVEKFQGYYKDGTGGTWDCRSFSVFYIVLTVLMFVLYGATGTNFFLAGSGILMIAASLFPLVQPHKKKSSSKFTYCFLLLLSLQYLTIHLSVQSVWSENMKLFFETTALIMSLFPFGYICIVASYIFVNQSKCGKWLIRKYYNQHPSGYTELH